MYLPKVYGESKVTTCPFCSRGAYSKNPQGIPVCGDHVSSTIENVKCACGQWLDLREGKWGPFFVCSTCGPVNFTKALTMKKEAETAAAIKARTGEDVGWKTQAPKPYAYVPSKGTGGSAAAGAAGAGTAKATIGQGWKAKRDDMWRDEYGQEQFIRSDDPRYEFK